MGNSLTKAVCIDFGVQLACWSVAAVLKTEKFYDLAGSGTFLYLALQSLKWGGTYYTRQRVNTGMVVSWAFRLGLFLFTRILKEGQDRRFNKVRDRPGRFLIFWMMQGVWVLLTLWPTLILNDKKEDKPLTTRDYVGWGLWIVGFLCEAVADHQKSVFRSNPDNKGQFIRHGLWSVVQYPNYLGEIMMWTGLYISASSVMKGKEYLSVISPLFVSFLLTKVSGIPLQEASAVKRYGANPDYFTHIKNTPKLIPFIW